MGGVEGGLEGGVQWGVSEGRGGKGGSVGVWEGRQFTWEARGRKNELLDTTGVIT